MARLGTRVWQARGGAPHRINGFCQRSGSPSRSPRCRCCPPSGRKAARSLENSCGNARNGTGCARRVLISSSRGTVHHDCSARDAYPRHGSPRLHSTFGADVAGALRLVRHAPSATGKEVWLRSLGVPLSPSSHKSRLAQAHTATPTASSRAVARQSHVSRRSGGLAQACVLPDHGGASIQQSGRLPEKPGPSPPQYIAAR